MKIQVILIYFLIFGISSYIVGANPKNDSRIEVCESVDISELANILGWDQSQIETESLSSSSNKKNGVCRYVHGDEDLVVVVKVRSKKNNKGGTVKLFGGVDGSKVEGSDKLTYEMNNVDGKYEVELNFGTEREVFDAHDVMEKIMKLVNKI